MLASLALHSCQLLHKSGQVDQGVDNHGMRSEGTGVGLSVKFFNLTPRPQLSHCPAELVRTGLMPGLKLWRQENRELAEAQRAETY